MSLASAPAKKGPFSTRNRRIFCGSYWTRNGMLTRSTASATINDTVISCPTCNWTGAGSSRRRGPAGCASAPVTGATASLGGSAIGSGVSGLSEGPGSSAGETGDWAEGSDTAGCSGSPATVVGRDGRDGSLVSHRAQRWKHGPAIADLLVAQLEFLVGP